MLGGGAPRSDLVSGSVDLDDTCDLTALRAYLVAHVVPGVDEVRVCRDGGSEHRRVVRVGEHGVSLCVTLPSVEVGLPRIDVAAPERPGVGATALGTARRWLGLDTDPRPAVAALDGDPVLGPLVRARPALRVPGAADPFEAAVFVVLGQHVSLAAARTFAGRLVAAYGGFPRAEVLAAADPVRLREVVGVTGARAATMVAIARAVLDGLDLAERGGADPAVTRARLLDLTGVGPWTADLIAMRCLRAPDVFLPGDLVLRKALGGVSAREAATVAEAWRPHRSLAVLHLWTHHALLPAR